MFLGNYIGYFQYVLFLFLLCGTFLLRLDAKLYKSEQHMKKEYKVATVLGWMHLGVGALILLGFLFGFI